MKLLHTKGAVLLIVALAIAAFMAPQCAFADDLAVGAMADTTSLTASAQKAAPAASIGYAVNVNGKWKKAKSNGSTASAGKKSNSVSAIRVSASSTLSGSVQYQVCLKKIGWQAVKSNNKAAGNSKGKRDAEAVRIALTGELSAWYDVSYRVKTASGWQAWKKNGQIAGSVGKGRILAMQVKLDKKPKRTAAGAGLADVRCRVSMKGSGWLAWVLGNKKAGKTGKGNQVKNFRIAVDKGSSSGSLTYRIRTKNGKWKAWKKAGKAVGSKQIEAFQVKLTGSMASEYDIVYRAYVDKVGWQCRVRNGATAGTSKGNKIRAIKVDLVPISERSGWVGSGSSWSYYENGAAVKSRWITTKESPIDMMTAKRKSYWIDANGKLAVDRFIDPSDAADAGAGFKAYATRYGYLLTDDLCYSDAEGKWYTADSSGKLTVAKSANLIIEKYVLWAVKIAGDKSHGYSQINRWGNPDYDCSSFVISALRSVGINTGSASYTGNMKSELTKHGFTWSTNLKNIRRGDILLVHNSTRQHTEIYLGNGKTVGAHIDENGGVAGKKGGDQTGNEISIGAYRNIWTGYLRFKI